jgi:hypothetical protein
VANIIGPEINVYTKTNHLKTLSYRLLTLSFIGFTALSACRDDDNTIGTIDSNTPTVSSYTPQSGFVGDTITLQGNNLDDNLLELSIAFGKVHATVIKSSATTAEVVVPDDLDEATTKIQFTTFKGAVVTVGDFKLKAPVIESFSPGSGYAGSNVVIKGKGFRKTSAIKQVKFGDKPVEASADSRTELTFSIPTNTPVGDYTIAVTVAGLTATASNPYHVVAPALTGFSPETAFIGDVITLTGNGFGTNPDALSIYFGNVQATVVSAAETSAAVVVPDDLEEVKTDIRFTTSGDNKLVAPNKFTVKAPVIESISPTMGLPGQLIRVKGKGFRNTYRLQQLNFGSTPMAANIINPANTELIMRVPDKSTAGTYAIDVNILDMVATAADKFEVITPTVTSFTPETGGEFTTITITGTTFIDPNGGNTGVIFSDAKTGLNSTAGYILSRTATELKVDVPRLSNGTWKITVMVLGASVTPPTVFTYTE